PLLLATGQLSDRSARVALRADQLDHLVYARPLGAPAPAGTCGKGNRDPPAGAVKPQLDEVDPPNPRGLVKALALGQVADPASCLLGSLAEHAHHPGGNGNESQNHSHQG